MVGRTVSHYKVLEKLGEGGMGEVYLAEDTVLDRKVALKFLPESLQQDETARKRFLREAKAAAALDHPFICNIYEEGQTDDGQDFISMEYVQGETLKERLAQEPLPLRDVIQVGIEIAEALEVAHREGIIHRDLKPANIMLTEQGHPKVMDFGLARKVVKDDGTERDITTSLTREGSTLGTLAYMSPEQIRARPVDHRSDVFSFGIVLYEMLTGVHPFRKTDRIETGAAIIQEEPGPLRRYVDDVPELLGRTVEKMLGKSPGDRYQSVHEVRTNLRELSLDVCRPIETATPIESRRKPSRISVRLGIAGTLLAVLFVYWMWSVLRQPVPPAEQDRGSIVTSALEDKPSVAVLPFVNMSGDPDQEYFSDGLTDEIIARISKIGGLKVISFTSSRRYKNSELSLPEIGEELGVATLLEGTVRREEDSVRITAQLIDANNEGHLWSETYQQALAGIFAIQSDIAQQIAAALQVELLPEVRERIEQQPTENQMAYDHFLQGMEYFARYTRQDMETALAFFDRALELDPNFALAHVLRAWVHAVPVYLFAAPRSGLEVAIEETHTALALDPNLASAYAALSWSYRLQGRQSQATEVAHKAVALDPNSSIAWEQLGYNALGTGKLDEAILFFKRTVDLDPQRRNGYFDLAQTYLVLADFDKAEHWLGKCVDVDPSFFGAHLVLAWVHVFQDRGTEPSTILNRLLSSRRNDPMTLGTAGLIALWVGNEAKALEHLEKAYVVAPAGLWLESVPYAALLGGVLWRSGGRSRAESLLDESVRILKTRLESGDERPDPLIGLALVHTIRDDEEEALRWLEQAIDAGWRRYDWAQRSPLWENLHDEPRFQQMVSEVRAKVDEMRLKVRQLEKEWGWE